MRGDDGVLLVENKYFWLRDESNGVAAGLSYVVVRIYCW